MLMDVKSLLLRYVKEIRETQDIKELATMLSSGEWIAIAASVSGDGKSILFSVGRVD